MPETRPTLDKNRSFSAAPEVGIRYGLSEAADRSDRRHEKGLFVQYGQNARSLYEAARDGGAIRWVPGQLPDTP